MAWPQSQDYNEAIQNPASSFGDAELRGGQAITNALGMPMPRSGNFADVYEYVGASGQKWALKCFTRQVPGLQERYAEISKCLVQAKLPFTVDFSYLTKGIRVQGEYYPILKMHWVEGFLLNEFVRDNLDKPALLDGLGQIWLRMSRRLTDAGIAHADLQHGNVILIPGSKAASLAVKLIDYDGMWVPALAQKKSGEVGHPCYQHPERLKKGTYNADVDRLPLLAIACALRCLAVGGKALWDKYDNGDNLLFREGDLRNPAASGLFKELWQINDPAAHDLTGYLTAALTGTIGQVPVLQNLMNGDGVTPLAAPVEQQVTALLGPRAVVDRSAPSSTAIQARGKARPAVGRASSTAVTADSGPDWSSLDDATPATPAPRPVRKAEPAISTPVAFAVAAVAMFVVGGLALWALSSGGPNKEAEVAAVQNDNVVTNRPASKPVPKPERAPVLRDPIEPVPPIGKANPPPADPPKANPPEADPPAPKKQPMDPADPPPAPGEFGRSIPGDYVQTKDDGVEDERFRLRVDNVTPSIVQVRGSNGWLAYASYDESRKEYKGFFEWQKFNEQQRSPGGEWAHLYEIRMQQLDKSHFVIFAKCPVYNFEIRAQMNPGSRPVGPRQVLAEAERLVSSDRLDEGDYVDVDNPLKIRTNILTPNILELRGANDWLSYAVYDEARKEYRGFYEKPTGADLCQVRIKHWGEGQFTMTGMGNANELTIRARRYDPLLAKKNAPTWDHITKYNPASVKAVDDYLSIEPNSGLMMKKSYTGPIEITAVARTAKNNIRMNAYNGMVIFNFEGKPSELCVTRPDRTPGPSNSKATTSFKPLAPNTWYKLVWRLNEKAMSISVDDKIVFREEGNYHLSYDRPIAIRAFTDRVDVKHFSVVSLPAGSSVATGLDAKLLKWVRAKVKSAELSKTQQMGTGQNPYEEVPKDGALLTGFEVKYGRFGPNPTVTAIRPIFQTANGQQLGTMHGTSGEGLIRVEAKPGYAVGAITVKAGLGVDGMSMTFMKITDNGLDPNDNYESEWLGGMGGEAKTKLAGTGDPVVGIFGKTAVGDSTFNGLGLVTVARPAALAKSGLKSDQAPVKLTAALVKKKLAGKVKYEPKTGVLVLTYDFKTADQLKDFDTQDVGTVVKGGMVNVPAGQRLKHLVKFKEGEVKGVVAVKSPKGQLVTTSEGVDITLDGASVHFIGHLVHVSYQLAANEKQGQVPFALSFRPDEFGYRYGNQQRKFQSRKDQAGFVTFHGGDGGFGFKEIVMTGIPDGDWAQEFFALEGKTAAGSPLPGNASDKPAADGFAPLFNGKDLTGWKTHPNGPSSWRVEKGVLTASGPGISYLFTQRADYKDFHVRAEAKINDGGNSGIFCRCPFVPLPEAYEAEIRIKPDGDNDTGSIYVRRTLMQKYAAKFGPGTWFTLDVIVTGNRVVIKVDGEKAADFTDPNRLYNAGHIALQKDLGPTTVEFRKIEIKELTAELPPRQGGADKVSPPDGITADLLKKKFQGAAEYDSETAVLTLTYDFTDPAQLKDFKAKGSRAAVKDGIMQIPATETMTHIARFKHVTVTGVMAVKDMKGKIMTTTGGVTFGLGQNNVNSAKPNSFYVIVISGGKVDGKAQFADPDEFQGNVNFVLRVLPEQLAFVYGGRSAVATHLKRQAGLLSFHGGEVGFGYSQLKISGVVDENWARSFFSGNEAAQQPSKITSALLRKKLQGKLSYEAETGALSLIYDFQAPAQLKDFEAADSKVAVKGGAMHVPANEQVKHIVKFKYVTIKGQVAVKAMKGKMLATTEGAAIELGVPRPNTWTFVPRPGSSDTPSTPPGPEDRQGNVAFELSILPEQTRFIYGAGKIMTFMNLENQAGFVSFHGGEVGYGYRQLTISGIIDDDWARGFFDDPAPAAPQQKK
jgi:hypothetical protein